MGVVQEIDGSIFKNSSSETNLFIDVAELEVVDWESIR